jgi:hypothetical protein
MSSLGPADKTSPAAIDGMAKPVHTSSAVAETTLKTPKNTTSG